MADTKIFDEIKEILEANGSIPQSTKDRLMLTAMLALPSIIDDAMEKRIKCVEDEIEILKRNNIVLWINKHPKLSVGGFVFFVIMANSNLINVLFTLLGYKGIFLGG